MKKRVFMGLMLLMAVFWTAGCGADRTAEETFHEETVENIGENTVADIEESGGDAGNEGMEAVQSVKTEQNTAAELNNGQFQGSELEIDDVTRQELTTQLLQENEMDTSIVESARMTKGCTFSLPDGFEEAEDLPGMYVTKRYPIDASTIYYVEMDQDISLQLLTEDTFLEQIQGHLRESYDLDIDVDLKSFEKISISGYPAFRILCSYTIDDVEITHLEYTINADKSYIITYSQTNEYDRMEEFEASAATIQLEY